MIDHAGASVMASDVVVRIAAGLGKTPAQVCGAAWLANRTVQLLYRL